MVTIIVDDKDVNKAIDNVLAALANPKPAFEDISNLMYEDVFDHFRKEEGPQGKWKKSWRVKLKGGTVLRDKGAAIGLIGTILQGRGADKTSAFLKTKRIYAQIHQFGGVIKPKTKSTLKFKGPDGKTYFKKSVTIPARPFFWISKAGASRIVKELGDYIMKAWNK